MVEKLYCWERKNCGKNDCPVFGKRDLLCWTVGGKKSCNGENLDPSDSVRHCMHCEVFRNNIQLEGAGGFSSLFSVLYSELEKSEAQLLLHRKISGLIQSTIEPEKILHVILNCVTAGYGLGFNRALLMLADEKGEYLEGVMGVAPASRAEAAEIWTELASLNLDAKDPAGVVELYEKQFQTRDHDIDNIVREIRVSLKEDNVFSYCVRNRKAVVCEPKKKEQVPGIFLSKWGSEYFAVAPLAARGKVLGIIVADNYFNGREITNEYLDLLGSFAFHAGLAVENTRLYEKIENRAVELEETNKRLKEIQEILMRTEKLSAVGEMAATVAHEMRSPLVSIGGYVRIVKESVKGDAVNTRRLETVITEVNRLEKIVKDVLDYVKPFKLTFIGINAKKITDEVLLFFKIGASRENIVIKTEFEDNLPEIQGDIEKLKQVFINILENAFDAMPEGGILNIKGSARDGFVELKFMDTGIGIKNEDLERIVKPFFTTKKDGIGLGLAIAEKIVKEHSGRLEVVSSAAGTTFKLTFPVA